MKLLGLLTLGGTLYLSSAPVPIRAATNIVPFCQCGDNGFPGNMVVNSGGDCAQDTRRVEDNSVCYGAPSPNPCSVSGTLTAYRCTDNSTLDMCIDIRHGYLGSVSTLPVATTNSSLAYNNFPNTPNLTCDTQSAQYAWAVRIAFTPNSPSGGSCSNGLNDNAVWIRHWSCDPPSP